MVQHLLDNDFERLMLSGCDRRLLVDENGLNRYGSSPIPNGTIQFGSCTCSTPSTRAIKVAKAVFTRLKRAPDPHALAIELIRIVREHIRGSFNLPKNVDIALTPSGTDVELLALALAAGRGRQPIVNLIVGPTEVGSGTDYAAAARHFDSLTPRDTTVVIGQPISTLASRVSRETIDIRDSFGKLLPGFEIDAATIQAATQAAASGAHVIVHLVAHSKTGIHAPSLQAIQSIKSQLQDNVTIVVDAAQGRLAPAAYHFALQRGYLVSLTGSKFFGGPPFCGALLVPKTGILNKTE